MWDCLARSLRLWVSLSPLEQGVVRPEALREDCTQHATELRAGHQGHLFPPSPAGESAPKAPASRARAI